MEVRFGRAVTAVEGADPAVVHTATGPIRARTVIACAGLWADRLARRAGASRDPPNRAVPRGLSRAAPRPAARLRGMIYPVPNPDLPFLGVHITRHIGGEVTRWGRRR